MRTRFFWLGLLTVSVAMLGLGRTPTRSSRVEAGAIPTPTPVTPVAVPGSKLNHNVATPKPGYSFAKDGKAVRVNDDRRYRMMGSYICIDAKGEAWPQGCYIQFSPSDITCKGIPSGGGTCQLTAAPPPAFSPN